ncbi:hypothetical protein [Pseudomonas aeruginosa]|uniref:hypothetical protein n=1 Tax=Pseudomonas aeruginosa TaxID=287 RepID=UPI000F51747F|nr:hypothetical protein [Pseudomonas aeruginosa]EIU1654915.1 hypothetical protein [Pseudomonas aeruginosa]EKU4548156.1 hypothetical protein [Pseudomonas aeruginosa]EKW2498144.1 hypothetical protein [Pseudomonas aeruginosa]EKX4039080.1 hypothetical protein [Pseudomonas aeruginosa]EKX7259616.1 hypothetical protein [Pseudomonas aeruginosa]
MLYVVKLVAQLSNCEVSHVPILHDGQLMGANFICLYFAWSSNFSGLILFFRYGAMNGFAGLLSVDMFGGAGGFIIDISIK